MTHTLNLKLAVLLGIGSCMGIRPAVADAATDLVTVVSSKAEGGYARARQPDGSYSTEYYAFADGGHWTGTVRDHSIDNLPFMDVARTIAGPLQSQNYIPTRDPKQTKLLIVVYYGRTRTPEHLDDSALTQGLQKASAAVAANKSQDQHQFYLDSQALGSSTMMPCFRITAASAQDTAAADNALAGALASASAADHTRDEVDAQNASLLGYESWWDATSGYKGTPLEHRRQDMIDELEHDRYFVILMAYDFQSMWRQKKHVLLWQTRFSVRQRGIEFDKELLAITRNASPYFGQDTHGLVRKDLPAGNVDIGPLKELGTVAAK